MFCNAYYDTGDDDAQSIANIHNNVTDLEVYMVKDGLRQPWREPQVWEPQFNPVSPATKDTPGFVKEPGMKDRIHTDTVVFVIDGSNVEVMPDGVVTKLKNIKEMPIVRESIFTIEIL